jgi:hypothetical protein
VNIEDLIFLYPRGQLISPLSLRKGQGFLVHNICLESLKRVQQETVSAQRRLSLRELLLVLKLSKHELNDRDFDWDYGDFFASEGGIGQWGLDASWNPVVVVC